MGLGLLILRLDPLYGTFFNKWRGPIRCVKELYVFILVPRGAFFQVCKNLTAGRTQSVRLAGTKLLYSFEFVCMYVQSTRRG